MSRKSQRLPKDAQGKAPQPHDARTRIEEAVVNLHSLVTYNSDELTRQELTFLKKSTKNLAVIHRRISRGTPPPDDD